MPKLSLFTLNYVESYDLLIIKLEWDAAYYPPHQVRIWPDKMEILVDEEGSVPEITKGDFSDLVIHADPLNILEIIQLLNKHIIKLEV